MGRPITRTDSISVGDLFVVYKTTDGDFRAVPADVLISYLNGALDFIPTSDYPAYFTQYAEPLEGFNLSIDDGESNNSSVHLIIAAAAGINSGSVTLPPVASCVDRQEVMVTTVRQIANFTVFGNGSSVIGQPNALSAESYFRLRFRLANETWYRAD